MSGRPARSLAALAATGLIAAVLPLASSAPAHADDPETPVYGGFSASSTATPLLLEVYEPTIPIPAEPQAEFRLVYTKALADSSTSSGRASWLWPGDPIGEGVKTFFEQLGLPAQLVEDGYPVQINSSHPGGEDTETDEPVPGMVMRTSSDDAAASASAGFSSDSDVSPKADEPAGSGNPLLDLLDQLAGGLQQGLGGGADEPEGGVPGLPPELAILVDVDGFTASSSARSVDGRVIASSRSNLGEIKLLGGLVTISGMDLRTTSTSDGATGANTTVADYGTLTLAGQKFAFGPEGIDAGGSKVAIPGLDSNPLKALEALGIKIEIPEPEVTIDGDQASSTVSGLRIEIDMAPLRPIISAIPSGQLADLLPDELIPEEAQIIKGLIGSISNLAPRVVLTLGTVESAVDTVPPMTMPDLPDVGPQTDGAGAGTGGDADGGGGDIDGAGGADGGLPDSAPDAGSADDGDLGDAAPVSASPGLPPLGSIPGMLLFGGIALAAAAGSYFRKLGVLALGAGAPCPHGLDSGLPDLRKM